MSRKKNSDPPAVRSASQEIQPSRGARERMVARLLTGIARTATMHATRALEDLELSVSQLFVLAELLDHDGCRQDDLRQFVALDKGNVTRAVQKLEDLGLVQRTPDPVDRRAVRVYATKKALKLEKEIDALGSWWDERLTAGFTSEERETMTDLLLRMERNVQSMHGEEED